MTASCDWSFRATCSSSSAEVQSSWIRNLQSEVGSNDGDDVVIVDNDVDDDDDDDDAVVVVVVVVEERQGSLSGRSDAMGHGPWQQHHQQTKNLSLFRLKGKEKEKKRKVRIPSFLSLFSSSAIPYSLYTHYFLLLLSLSFAFPSALLCSALFFFPLLFLYPFLLFLLLLLSSFFLSSSSPNPKEQQTKVVWPSKKV